MARCTAHLACSVDTDAIWRAIAQRSVDDVIGEFPIHSLTVGTHRHAVQRTPVRHCRQQTIIIIIIIIIIEQNHSDA